MRRQNDYVSPIDRIAQKIIAKLEEGTMPWKRSWDQTGFRAPLRWNGAPYNGINYFTLMMASEESGYSSPYWMTYKKAQELGGQVRKGEHASHAIFYKSYTPGQRDTAGGDEEDPAQRRVAKCYTVFNADQIDNLPQSFHPAPAPLRDNSSELQPIVEAITAATGARIEHHGNRAYYAPGPDMVVMPPLPQFHDYEAYAATLMHELIHWTSAVTRLDRQLGKRFGDEAYAAEELIAELGAARLGDAIGLPASHIENHAAYIGSWIKVLRSDPRAILTAAAKADAAARYIYPDIDGVKTVADDDEEREAA